MTATVYRDVELKVEIETTTKVSSLWDQLLSVDNTKREVELVTISGENIEKAVSFFSEACGYDLQAKQMLEIVCHSADLIEWVSSGSFDSMTAKLFCDVFKSCGGRDILMQ